MCQNHSSENTSLNHHSEEHTNTRVIEIEESVLKQNEELAKSNRKLFDFMGFIVVNIVSSPGSGKTTLLERTVRDLKDEFKIAVIEGDQQTDRDSMRIKAAGAPVYQINTINSCHLDAHMVEHALMHLREQVDIRTLDILFIENVGNLICPGAYDLGEDYRVVAISITEGEDKPLKYPGIFIDSQVAIVNKIDIAETLKADPDKYECYIHMVSPQIQCLKVSAKTGENMDEWYNWLREKRYKKLVNR